MPKYTSSKTSVQPDREWFVKNPYRSHRLRAMFNGEFSDERLDPIRKVTPDGHELMVLVRQLRPGMRVRMVYCRNVACPIPDEEAILHALFDLNAETKDGEGGKPITVAEVKTRALKYVRGGHA